MENAPTTRVPNPLASDWVVCRNAIPSCGAYPTKDAEHKSVRDGEQRVEWSYRSKLLSLLRLES